ncbi:hypothetical protein CONLIGDRAFT_693931 [Coniochaeta ligniaria NRRL 30616]|uniref:Uncharacterized protein n=1 Tax=Coniochaeta ligniaria NRRL 30616 TaxID=1408157 RepID=A0A1J7J2C7_9PEZI|nr:hypothetical protein CONLIGDRAFT_693931 [Coniochaeta ligniaria NRRL 30616]
MKQRPKRKRTTLEDSEDNESVIDLTEARDPYDLNALATSPKPSRTLVSKKTKSAVRDNATKATSPVPDNKSTTTSSKPTSEVSDNKPTTAPSKPSTTKLDYELWTDAQLYVEVAKFGFKEIKSRKGMLDLLKECKKSEEKRNREKQEERVAAMLAGPAKTNATAMVTTSTGSAADKNKRPTVKGLQQVTEDMEGRMQGLKAALTSLASRVTKIESARDDKQPTLEEDLQAARKENQVLRERIQVLEQQLQSKVVKVQDRNSGGGQNPLRRLSGMATKTPAPLSASTPDRPASKPGQSAMRARADSDVGYFSPYVSRHVSPAKKADTEGAFVGGVSDFDSDSPLKTFSKKRRMSKC